MMKQYLHANSNGNLVSAQPVALEDKARLWQKGIVQSGAKMVLSTLIWGAWVAGANGASAQTLTPDRPALPAMSLTEDGAMSIWRNPANLGFDPDPSVGLVYGTPLDSGDGPATAPNSLAFAANGGPLGFGFAYQSKFTHPEWWTISSGLAIPFSDTIQLGAHTATMPAKTFRQLMSHPLTDRGLEGFMRDWAEVEKAGNA